MHSRIHPLPSLSQAHRQVWVKREDELGFGVSGTKKRKYLSLLPFLKAQNFAGIALIGGEHSNHLAAFAQLLNENRLGYEIFLKPSQQTLKKGNAFLLDLLTADKKKHYVAGKDWEKVVEIAESYMHDCHGAGNYFVVPEGGSCEQSISGLATLYVDIVRNEQENQLTFDHIFIDSGTGLQAATLAYQLALHGADAQLHVVHVAGGQADFERGFELCCQYYRQPLTPLSVRHHVPATAKAFGSVNASIWAEIRYFAQTEGLLLDPIYTAKLCYTARRLMDELEMRGNVLIVHTGGGTGLMGFAG